MNLKKIWQEIKVAAQQSQRIYFMPLIWITNKLVDLFKRRVR